MVVVRRRWCSLLSSAQLEAEGHVVEHSHVRVECVALEHHRNVAVFGRNIVDDAIADPHDAAGDLLQPGDHT